MMNGLRQRMSRHDQAVWIRAVGTALTSATGFMVRPFLVLYLYDKLGESVLLPMAIVGLQPLTATVAGYYGGHLADRWGRKPVMMAALSLQVLSMGGYALAENVWAFAVLSMLNGLCMALFQPAANAQISDIVPKERQAETFALIHTALNFGAAVGPMTGMALFRLNPDLVFSMAALASLTYLLLVWRRVPETMPVKDIIDAASHAPEPFRWSRHGSLLAITCFAVPIGLLYASVETVFPLHLKERFTDYQTMLATLMTINGITVILLQMWVARRSERLPAHRVLLASYVILAAVAYGYGHAATFGWLIFTELLFTIGEMLCGPHFQKTISHIAPEHMRGRYFSVFSMNWQLARAFGPAIGGLLFEAMGGKTAYLLLALLLLAAGLSQYRMVRSAFRKASAETAAGVLQAEA